MNYEYLKGRFNYCQNILWEDVIYKIDNEAIKMGLQYSLFENINDALNAAIEDSDENDSILVTGSTFLFSDLY